MSQENTQKSDYQFRTDSSQSQSQQQYINQSKQDVFKKFDRKNQWRKNKYNHICNTKKQSKYQQVYRSYFNEVQDSVVNHLKQKQNIRIQNEIMFINLNEQIMNQSRRPIIKILQTEYEQMIITYQIIIGNIQIVAILLNIHQISSKNLQKIGNGSYGEIYKLKNGYLPIVIKRLTIDQQYQILSSQLDQAKLKIRMTHRQINSTLQQFAIYKIASFYQIGPYVQKLFGFDIICFNDSTQFFMEQCQKVQYRQQFGKRMKFCVRVFHQLKIVHKDIKPSNVMFSKHFNNFVLIDFGISQNIPQKLGQISLSHKQGTFKYMSPQMASAKRQKIFQIDLFYNDLWALKLTINNIKNKSTDEEQEQKFRPKSLITTTFTQINQTYVFIELLSYLIGNKDHALLELIKKYEDILNQANLIKRIHKSLNQQLFKKLKFLLSNYFQKRQQEFQNKGLLLKNYFRIYPFDHFLVQKLQKLDESPFINKLIKKITEKNYKPPTRIQLYYLRQQGQINKLMKVRQKEIEQIQMKKKNTCNQKILNQYRCQLIGNLIQIFQVKIRHKKFYDDCAQILIQLKKYFTEINKIVYYLTFSTIYNMVVKQQQFLEQDQCCFEQLYFIYNNVIQIYFINKNFSKLIALSNKLELLFQKHQNFCCYQGWLYLTKAIMNLQLSNYQQTKNYAYKLNDISQNNKNFIYFQIEANLLLSKYQLSKYNLIESQKYFIKAQKIYLLQEGKFNRSYQLIFYVYKGVLKQKQNQFQQAIALFQKSLKLIKFLLQQYDCFSNIVLKNIGSIYLKLNNIQLGLEYNKKAEQKCLLNQSQNVLNLGQIYRNYGYAYNSLNQFQLGQSYLYKSIEIFQKYLGKQNQEIGQSYFQLYLIKSKFKKEESHINYLKLAQKIIFKSNNIINQIFIKIKLCQYYQQMQFSQLFQLQINYLFCLVIQNFDYMIRYPDFPQIFCNLILFLTSQKDKIKKIISKIESNKVLSNNNIKYYQHIHFLYITLVQGYSILKKFWSSIYFAKKYITQDPITRNYVSLIYLMKNYQRVHKQSKALIFQIKMIIMFFKLQFFNVKIFQESSNEESIIVSLIIILKLNKQQSLNNLYNNIKSGSLKKKYAIFISMMKYLEDESKMKKMLQVKKYEKILFYVSKYKKILISIKKMKCDNYQIEVKKIAKIIQQLTYKLV